MYDQKIFEEMGEFGFFGVNFEGYGCVGVFIVVGGLIICVVECVDSGYWLGMFV